MKKRICTLLLALCLTLGLLIDLASERIEDVSVSLNSDLARCIVKEYFVGKRVVKDSAQIIEEINMRHRGNAVKAIIKAYTDIQQNYISYAHTYSDGRTCSEPD